MYKVFSCFNRKLNKKKKKLKDPIQVSFNPFPCALSLNRLQKREKEIPNFKIYISIYHFSTQTTKSDDGEESEAISACIYLFLAYKKNFFSTHKFLCTFTSLELCLCVQAKKVIRESLKSKELLLKKNCFFLCFYRALKLRES